ncbi:MAG: CDGSH iron-sulfur domain-containing protein [Candidatus Cryosericum sp.]
MSNKRRIQVTKDGPYVVSAGIPLSKETIIVDEHGTSDSWKETEKSETPEDCALCRCGHSRNKPFCDGTHQKIGFDGTETAQNKPYEQSSQVIRGPALILRDKTELCADARFCDKGLGTWELTERSRIPAAREMAIDTAGKCPSGRLVCYDRETRQPIEPACRESIALVEDPQEGVSGPLWVRGKIPVESSEGKEYEPRNRVTLCRCGASGNKPFCDGSHVGVKFSDRK